MIRAGPAFLFAVVAAVLLSCAKQPVSLDVNGTVVGILGEGLGGVGVAIGDDTTTTAADGTFTFSGLSVPYDLTVYTDDSGHVFQGMTRADPTVFPIGALGLGGYPIARIEGNLPGPVPIDHEAQVCVEGITVPVYNCTIVPAGEDFYSVAPLWAGAESVDVRVHALLIKRDSDGFPESFPAYFLGEGTISEDVTEPIDLAEGALPRSTTVTGSMSAPAGYAPFTIAGSVRLSPNFVMPILDVSAPPSSSFSFQMPEFSDETSYQLLVTAKVVGVKVSTSAWRSEVPGGSSTAIPLPPAPAILEPEDAATGVTTVTPFSIDETSGGIATFFFYGAGPRFAVTTADATATIPDLSAFGLELPASAAYNAEVYRVPEALSMDDAGVRWIGDYLAAGFFGASRGGPGVGRDGSIGVNHLPFTTE